QYLLLASIFAILLSGCASKEEKALLEKLKKNTNYHKRLKQTEKLQLFDVNGTAKVLLIATYLYEQSTEKNDSKEERFIIGIQVSEEAEQSLQAEGYSLSLAGKAATSIVALEHTDILLKDLSFKSQWSSYYLVHFPHSSQKSFKLILSTQSYGSGSLYFAKVAKYVLSKKAF
ncbi:MAG: hypothetical protein DRQ78_12850, partial [Epsilonproteobacteria bacterium]